ncbi:hypothetical protein H2203_007108 [Taxawa tesnikishii (nom. ined.)]|nr:hypothetical protein H2203_007108 [Dothideales sp. JES 119]
MDEFAESDIRRIALGDYVTRAAASYISRNYIDQSSSGTGWSGPKGGAFNINAPGQEVLPRTSAVVSNTHPNRTIELRFTVALPARGRTILGQQALSILHVKLPDLVRSVLMYQSHNKDHIARHLHAVEDQHFMRSQLQERGLVAFVANGAVLPRASGSSARPMTGQGVVPFQSPPDLEVVLKRKHGAGVRGMGIPHGVTLLTGGGFHGKSTLLEALELSVYDHIPGDGRELIVSDRTAVKVRAEDGRSVTATDISPFISNLPGGKSTKKFATDDASGSTSMAANIQEALESGCKALLIDEDSSATNLLVRDQRMQQLVRHEPITPLVSKVRALYSQHGVSTVIVIGGLGDWLSVADFVIGMESYVPRMLTSDAANIVQQLPTHVHQDSQYGALPQRNIHYPQDVLQGSLLLLVVRPSSPSPRVLTPSRIQQKRSLVLTCLAWIS